MRAWLWLLLLVTLSSGCPRPTDDEPPVDLPDEADEFTAFGELMASNQGFTDELKRLQGGVARDASIGNAQLGGAAAEYRLLSRIEPTRIGLVLEHRLTGEEWVVWAWRQEESATEATIIRDEATAGGYQLEFNIAGPALTVSLKARWLQERYVQISRELILGGLDHDMFAAPDFTRWTVSGEWLPYRLTPGESHGQLAYGVVEDRQADGEWRSNHYPQSLIAPAVAAYDDDHGILLSVADEHPRLFDRQYEVAWRVAPDYSAGELIALDYAAYDPTHDQFREPYLISGLPVRDSIVLEPFAIEEHSKDPTLCYAETREVIALMGLMTRCFQFTPEVADLGTQTGMIEANSWLETTAEIPDFLRRVSGIWDARLAEAQFGDSALNAGGYLGIDAVGLTGGAGLGEDTLAMLDMFDPESMRIMAKVDYLMIGNCPPYLPKMLDWCSWQQQGDIRFSGDRILLDIRNPDVAAWLVRKMAGDIEKYPRISGYSLVNIFEADNYRYEIPDSIFTTSYPAAASLMYLKTAEAVRQARPDAIILTDGGLRVGLPAFGDYHLNRNKRTIANFGNLEHPDRAFVWLRHADRLSSVVDWELFGTPPLIDFGDTLAEQVMATTVMMRGHYILREHEAYPGFASFSENQRELRAAGGDLRFIMSDPPAAAYLVNGKRPAECDKLIAILPADWSNTSAVWLAFWGTNGAVKVDGSNKLTVTWDGGSWEDKLPPGYWVIEHPSPEALGPGDAVLIKRQPLFTPQGGLGASG
ncbi:hypothetical protein JW859_13455 [bacterium]|nr:hypothetical protein [bacterium]